MCCFLTAMRWLLNRGRLQTGRTGDRSANSPAQTTAILKHGDCEGDPASPALKAQARTQACKTPAKGTEHGASEAPLKPFSFPHEPSILPLPAEGGGTSFTVIRRGTVSWLLSKRPRASTVSTVAAHGTPWADPRASTVSRVAAPGTASADPRASTVSTLTAHGTAWADPRASTVSRVAAPGTPSADPRASTVSRVAPARNVGVSNCWLVLVIRCDTLVIRL